MKSRRIEMDVNNRGQKTATANWKANRSAFIYYLVIAILRWKKKRKKKKRRKTIRGSIVDGLWASLTMPSTLQHNRGFFLLERYWWSVNLFWYWPPRGFHSRPRRLFCKRVFRNMLANCDCALEEWITCARDCRDANSVEAAATAAWCSRQFVLFLSLNRIIYIDSPKLEGEKCARLKKLRKKKLEK